MEHNTNRAAKCTGATLLILAGGGTSKHWPRKGLKCDLVGVQEHQGKERPKVFSGMSEIYTDPKVGRNCEGQRKLGNQNHRERGLLLSHRRQGNTVINFSLKPAGDFSHIVSHADKALQTDNQHLRMEHRSDPAQKWVKLITFCRALPPAAATNPLSLAQNNHDSTHHEGYQSGFQLCFPS